MPKITKRLVESVKSQKKDYVVWDSDMSGFGLRVFASGKRSYVIQYRRDGRSRRYTIGLHGIWVKHDNIGICADLYAAFFLKQRRRLLHPLRLIQARLSQRLM
mgnify:CR=1 FL=1